MKKFILFGYEEYYPEGGINDVVAIFDSSADAVDYVKSTRAKKDFYHCMDTELLTVVFEAQRGAGKVMKVSIDNESILEMEFCE